MTSIIIMEQQKPEPAQFFHSISEKNIYASHLNLKLMTQRISLHIKNKFTLITKNHTPIPP